MIALGVVALDQQRQARRDLPLIGEAARRGPRVLEILVEDEHVGEERRADLRRRDQVRVRGHGAQDRRQRAAAEDALAQRAVGRAGGGQDQPGDAGVEDAARGAHHPAAVPLRIPGDPQPRLPHVVVRRDGAVRGEGLGTRRGDHGLADERREEDLVGRRPHVGLDLRLPAQAILDGDVGPRLPVVLQEDGGLLLRDLLRAGIYDGMAVGARLLQVEEHRPGDRGARRAGARLRGAAVRALDVARVLGVVEEAVRRAEDEAAVGEADEGLVRAHPVVLDAPLDGVIAAQDREVVVELIALVVVLDRDEERHAEAVAVGEIEGGVGQRPAVDQRPVVGPRPVLAGVLETELVEQGRGEGGDERAGAGVRLVLLDRVGAAPPGVDVEGAVGLLGPGVGVAQGELVLLGRLPVELGEQHPGVVGAVDGTVLAGVADAGEVVHHPLLDARRIVLLGRAPPLVVGGDEVEGLVRHDRPAEREAGLGLGLVEFRRQASRGLLGTALAPSATTTTSLTASRLKVKAGRWPPRCSPKNGLLKSAPSTEMLLWIPFWPLIDSSSPSGPWTVVTPGVILVKSRKLRPLLGRSSIAFASMRTDPSARVVSTTGASAVTVTSPAAATWRVSFRWIVCPTPRSVPSRTTLANPGSSAVTR